MTEFKTSDIVLAACLRLNNNNIDKITIVGNKGHFLFTNVDDDFIRQFDLGHHTVEPVAFNNMIKQLTTSVRRMTQQSNKR